MEDVMQKKSSTEKETQKVYHLTIPFDELHLGKFLSINAAVYFGENVIYYPFDVLRTKLQVQRDVNFNIAKTVNLVKSVGWRGMYAGFWPYTIGSLPSHGVYFLAYNVAKDKLQEVHERWQGPSAVKGKQALWVSFSAGAIADIACNALFVPLEVVVQRLQIQDNKSAHRYNGSFDAIKAIYKNEGVRGFYRGFGATLLTYAPASAIWWAAYEHFKVVLADTVFSTNNHRDSTAIMHVEQSVPAQVIAGGLAGLITAVLTNPMDVIKTRLQTQHHQQHLQEGAVKTLYKNSWEASKFMLREEGWRSFTKGLGPRVLTSTFFSSWFGLIYEAVLQWSKK